MSHKHGSYLGSVRSLADVRLRCVVDDVSGCWHLRTANGQPYAPGRKQVLWLHQRGAVYATKAVWELAHPGQALPAGRRAVRVCGSRDCVNPAHIRALNLSDAQRRMVGDCWGQMSLPRRHALQRIQHGLRKLTPEQIAEIRHSDAPGAALARKFGVAPDTVRRVRRGQSYRHPVGASVWAMAA